MDLRNFFSELKRRNVYKVAVAYAIVGWLLVQVATQVFPFFEIPNWAVRLIVLAIGIGWWWTTQPRRNPTSPAAPSTANAANQKSIAVLPFVNMSADKNDEYLSDGMTEELINVLAKVPGLRVPGRTSCFAFKGKNE